MMTAWQLRSLIANDEALLEHYAHWMQAVEPGELLPTHIPERAAQTMRRLTARRAALLELLSPAVTTAHSDPSSAIRSLFTSSARPLAKPFSHV